MLTLEELNRYNEEEEREDTLYQVEVYRYRKGYSGYIDDTGDPVFSMTNDFEKALDEFHTAINYLNNNEYAVVQLKEAEQIYNRDVEYVTIKEFDSRIREDIYRSLEYIFDDAYNKENPMVYLESLPHSKDADYDEDVKEFIKELYDCIRKQDEESYDSIKDELIEHYFVNQCNYEF